MVADTEQTFSYMGLFNIPHVLKVPLLLYLGVGITFFFWFLYQSFVKAYKIK